MNKWAGNVGYVTEVTTNGITKYVVEERPTKGDLPKDWSDRINTNSNSTIDDISIGNQVSFVAGRYAYTHSQNIRYATIDGQRWRVTNVEIARPRLILTLGGVYNGPAPTPATSDEA